GPAPNRPSAGSRSVGMVIEVATGSPQSDAWTLQPREWSSADASLCLRGASAFTTYERRRSQQGPTVITVPRRDPTLSDLIDTTEMYLRTILDLEEEGIVPLRARIAERLEHSGPTVSQTVARMERDDLLRLTESRHLELTDQGR